MFQSPRKAALATTSVSASNQPMCRSSPPRERAGCRNATTWATAAIAPPAARSESQRTTIASSGKSQASGPLGLRPPAAPPRVTNRSPPASPTAVAPSNLPGFGFGPSSTWRRTSSASSASLVATGRPISSEQGRPHCTPFAMVTPAVNRMRCRWTGQQRLRRSSNPSRTPARSSWRPRPGAGHRRPPERSPPGRAGRSPRRSDG